MVTEAHSDELRYVMLIVFKPLGLSVVTLEVAQIFEFS